MAPIQVNCPRRIAAIPAAPTCGRGAGPG